MQAFVENKASMPRRNAAAAFLVAALGIATNNVNIPVAPLTATVNAPAIFNGNINLAQTNASPVFIDRVNFQPHRRGGRHLIAVQNVSTQPSALSIPSSALQLALFAPQVTAATPILSGQDLQYNKDWREDWIPPRRNFVFALNNGPTINVNVLPLGLTGYAPTVTLTGTVAPQTLSLNLNAFAPSILQANSGLVQVPALQLVLGAFGPNLFVTGNLLVPPPALTLNFPTPIIIQGTVPGQANLPNVPYISGIGPWDITLRTYG